MGEDTLRSIDMTRVGATHYRATNVRGGELEFGSGEDEAFTPVELLLTAIAGCSAIDVELITHKRAESTRLTVHAEGEKVRDGDGNHLTELRLAFDVTFPDGEAGDAARGVLSRAIRQSRDRLCTVSRTVQLGGDVAYERTDGVALD